MNTRHIKIKLLLLFVIVSTAITVFCGFTLDTKSSVKTLTKPYITTYECNVARLGNEDLLEKYDYLKITFLDDKKLEVSWKRKNGKRRSYECEYFYNDEKGTVEAELGILGFKFRQETKIENGRFTLSMPILGKPLIMIFAS